MFAELERLSYSFGCGEHTITLRYDIAALTRLEQCGLSYEDIFAERITGRELVTFLEAGCAELPVRAAEVLRETGAQELWRHIRAAVMMSLPVRDPLVIDIPENAGTAPDMKRLRCFICDVMRKPEEFFWHSTMRELCERWQCYAEVKGYAEKPRRMEMFDLEGME